MHRLFRLLHHWKCKNAAQKLALDALRRLPEESAERWPDLFLWHVEPYLRGIDAPEREFRDFTNHVLYAAEEWGGAARLARKWYWRTVESLRCGEWSEAAYHAGVLARYAAFPFSPLRTGHDERGLQLRTPVEWVITQLYGRLTAADDSPDRLVMPSGDEWLEELLILGAVEAREHLDVVVNGFDFNTVVNDPAALNDELRVAFGRLVSLASTTLGAILGRAIRESGAEPPRFPLGIAAAFAIPSLPLFWLTRSQAAAAEWKSIRAMHREFQQTGRIEASLHVAATAVRDAYAIDVLKQSPGALALNPPRTLPTESVGAEPAAKSQSRRFAEPISESSPAAAAASISAEFVERLSSLGIETVGNLLSVEPDEIASDLGAAATALDVAAWQDEARLCCELHGLDPVEAQLLVACGVTGAADLAALEPVELWELVAPVAESPDGRRLLRGDPPPDLDAVTRWIDAANRARRAA